MGVTESRFSTPTIHRKPPATLLKPLKITCKEENDERRRKSREKEREHQSFFAGEKSNFGTPKPLASMPKATKQCRKSDHKPKYVHHKRTHTA